MPPAFSSDGTVLVVGTAVSTFQLWDTTACAGFDGTVVEHDVAFLGMEDEEMIAEICERTGLPLSREEWEAYVPDLPFRRVCPG